LAYIFVVDSMGLSSFTFVQWPVGSKRCIFSAIECVLAVQRHSRSSKVDNFGTNRKLVRDFLLVINSNWFYLAPFLRYGNLLGKNCQFFPPHYYSAPSLPVFPLEFRAEVNHEETRVTHGAIRFMRIFAGVRLGRGVKRHWGL